MERARRTSGRRGDAGRLSARRSPLFGALHDRCLSGCGAARSSAGASKESCRCFGDRRQQTIRLRDRARSADSRNLPRRSVRPVGTKRLRQDHLHAIAHGLSAAFCGPAHGGGTRQRRATLSRCGDVSAMCRNQRLSIGRCASANSLHSWHGCAECPSGEVEAAVERVVERLALGAVSTSRREHCRAAIASGRRLPRP